MEPDNVIEVRDVRKVFGTHKSCSLKDRAIYFAKGKKSAGREVLRNVSFDVKKGEAVAIVGRNGSGKSTMLKLLTKIIRPDGGSIETKGRISCLIELGAGFHPDMSGRENVYINSSIFGLDKKETDLRMQDILDFSEIEEFIDERVRDYSSGMYMRLAFSIAINVNADILIVDEILSVGDIAYQKKCLDKIRELKEGGVTIVLVTQSPDQARSLCDRTIWIDGGDIKMIGESSVVCNAYESYMMGIAMDKALQRATSKSYEGLPCGPSDTWHISHRVRDPEIDVVSFDVFDTLLVRPSLRPLDMLKLMDTGDHINSEFRLMRWFADDRAYNDLRAKETLDDIYEYMGKLFGLPSDYLENMKANELELESRFLRPNPQMKKLFEDAKQAGKDIILISDTYFPESFLKMLMDKNGYTGIRKIYCSDELGMRKDLGDMYDFIPKDLGTEPQKILHIGNSRFSDGDRPYSKGYSTYLCETPSDVLNRDALSDFQKHLNMNLDNDLLWGVYANMFVSHNESGQEQFSTPYDFGLFLGPMFLEFTLWLCECIGCHGHKKLLLCYRDGYIIEKILDILARTKDLGFQYGEVRLPRIVRHPFYSEDRGLLGSLMDMGIDPGMSVEDFIRFRMYVEDEGMMDEAVKIFKSAGYNGKTESIGSINRIYRILHELDPIFKKVCESVTTDVRRYCQETVKDGDALFDVGYRGSILTFLRDRVGINIREYQLLSNPETFKTKYPEDLENYVCYPKVLTDRCIIFERLIENILSVQEAELLKITYGRSSGPAFVFGKECGANEVIGEVQKGVLDYVEYAVSVFGEKLFDMKFDHNFEIFALVEVLDNPTPSLIEIVRHMNVQDSSQIVGSREKDPFSHWCFEKS